MKTRIEAVWDEIASAPQQTPLEEDAYLLRRLDPSGRYNIFAGVDGSGGLLLAFGIVAKPPAILLKSSALDYFRKQRKDQSWLMCLRLRHRALSGVFGRLCQDLVDATGAVVSEAELVRLVSARLELWRKLFNHGAAGELQPHEAKGLLAELLEMEDVLGKPGRWPLDVITAWVGPSGADQDFRLPDLAIEVKAVGPDAAGVTISSLEQLESPLPITLSVYTLMPASSEDPKSMNLNQLVARLENRIAGSADALVKFRTRLLEAGFVEGPYYDTLCFRTLRQERFEVTERVPTLVRSKVASGIISASYTISLQSLREGC